MSHARSFVVCFAVTTLVGIAGTTAPTLAAADGAAAAAAAAAAVAPKPRLEVGPALGPQSLRDIVWVSDPQTAPDGRTAFVKTVVDEAADDYATDVWVADANGDVRPLTQDPAEDLLPRWSPDGKRLAFVSKRSGKRQVHVLESAGGEPWQLTDVEDGVGTYSWAPDGRSIAFTSTTPTAEEKARRPEAEPNPKHAKPPFVTDRLRTRSDGTPGWLSPKRRHVWVVPVGAPGKATARRVTHGDFDHAEPQWSRDSRQLYVSGVRKPDADYVDTDTEIYVVPADGSAEPRALTDRRGPDENPTPSPDGKWLAYTGFDESTPFRSYVVTHLYVMNLETGEKRRLGEQFDRSVGDGTISDMGAPRGDGVRMVWRADSKGIYFVSADRGQAQLHEATLDGRIAQLTRLPQGEVRAFDVSKRGDVIAAYSSPTEPTELHAFRVRDAGERKKWRALTKFNAALVASNRLVPYEEVWYRGAAPVVAPEIRPTSRGDGAADASATDASATVNAANASGAGSAANARAAGSSTNASAAGSAGAERERQWIQGWILKPPGFDPKRKYPAVLYIHGGPHAMYGTGFFHEFQVLANAGFVVLITNPRGSTGYGEAFGNAVQYVYPGDDYHDLMAGVDELLRRGYVDEKRMVVGGGSGGGLLTSWTVGHTNRFAAALVERAVTNWHSFVGTADLNDWFANRWFRDYPWRDTKDYLARSPLQYVDKVETPVLVLHNQDDFRTALDQGLQYYAALKILKKPAKLAVFPDSSHGMSRNGRPSQRLARLELILDWFQSHTK